MNQIKNDFLEKLEPRLEQERQKIETARKKGTRVVAYSCPYIPEELFLAAGMLPLRFLPGSNSPASPEGGPAGVLHACLPYSLRSPSKTNFCQSIDAICVASNYGDKNALKGNLEDAFSKPVFILGLPEYQDRLRSNRAAFEYFKNQLKLLKKELERFNSSRVTYRNTLKASSMCKRIREKLRFLYDQPSDDRSPIEWGEVLRINRAGFLINRPDFLRDLESLEASLIHARETKLPVDSRPRLMVAGSDESLDGALEIVRQAGGNVVTDYICSASMRLRKRVPVFGVLENPLDSLVEQYLYNAPCVLMGDAPGRVDRMLRLARRYRVHGLVYLGSKHCQPVAGEYELISEAFYSNLSVPSLFIEAESAALPDEDLQGRVGEFIDIIGGRV